MAKGEGWRRVNLLFSGLGLSKDSDCISRKYPPLYQAQNAVKETYYIESKHGKQLKRVRFPCAICGDKVTNKLVRRDHIIPVVDPKVGFPKLSNGEDDWNTFIKRLFCDSNNIQIICKNCHDLKSEKERQSRKKVDKKQKKR